MASMDAKVSAVRSYVVQKCIIRNFKMYLWMGVGMIGIGSKKHDLVQINSASVHGETGTGFEKRKQGKFSGPFECMNCEYFKNHNACDQKDMKEKSKQPRHSNGMVVVNGRDCCSFIERME